MDILTQFIFPAIAGVGIGVLSGLLGIGGGTIMIPLFRLVFGMSPLMSTATSLFTVIPTSIAGMIGHIRNKSVYVAFGVAAGLGGACTSPIGVWLSTLSPGWMVIAATAIVIIYSASSMLIRAIRTKPVKATASRGVTDDATPVQNDIAQSLERQRLAEEQKKFTPKQLVGAFFIGIVTGLAAGYVGLGGGFLMVPLMVNFFKMPMRYASGTSLVTIMILAIPGVITQGFYGNIEYLAGIAIAIGSIPGAFFGARLVNYVPERVLKLVFGSFLIVAAILLLVNEFVLA